MGETRERILETALELFARDGYRAVSTGAIAGELGMSKAALYKHFKSKRDIFDCVISRMESADAEGAREHALPTGRLSDMEQSYRQSSLEKLREYSEAQFRLWTEDKWHSCFRRILTVEQYRDADMAELYSQYLSAGPLGYVADILAALLGERERAFRLALAFYSPLFLLYSVYDFADDRAAVLEAARGHINNFSFTEEQK